MEKKQTAKKPSKKKWLKKMPKWHKKNASKMDFRSVKLTLLCKKKWEMPFKTGINRFVSIWRFEWCLWQWLGGSIGRNNATLPKFEKKMEKKNGKKNALKKNGEKTNGKKALQKKMAQKNAQMAQKKCLKNGFQKCKIDTPV
eukprot:TRINITY_DN1727_c1_g1_i4.p1 TRINITY_DN1727_c1_g1~~TRINITY_DN1727_c1_g1_i4.p1  ORF type:complete len:154 (-),score=45.74 TRINITY_DN1727_c1_g1_i4:60-485(-)